MINPNLKLGDIVKIRESSAYFPTQGHYGVGTIEKINRGATTLPYLVRFKNGSSLVYGGNDLELSKITNWKEEFENEKKRN